MKTGGSHNDLQVKKKSGKGEREEPCKAGRPSTEQKSDKQSGKQVCPSK